MNREGRPAEALAILEDLLVQHPRDARAHFEYAGALDFLGREQEAIAPYRKAQALGLDGDDLPRFYVQLGSTLRNVGDTAAAIELLDEGRDRFPHYLPIRAFRALALASAGRSEEGVADLLDALVELASGGLDGYERAIRSYASALVATDP